jgi:ABC-type multidrug transport system ATPase subunit
MLAGTLQQDKDHVVGGTIAMNKFTTISKDVAWSNLVGYIDQIDRLHPWLTVKETCEFAWRCRSGGSHRTPLYGKGEEIDAEVKKMDEALLVVNHVLIGLGLARVQDTFVGDQENVRGVSGGEKRRVTVAEMGVTNFPVLCADEISTGLDGKLIPAIVSFHPRTAFLSLTRELCSSCHHIRYCSAHGRDNQTSELHQDRIAASAATRDVCTV